MTDPRPLTEPPEPVPGEVWQEADGCLLTRSRDGRWWAFGLETTIADDSDTIARPLRRVFDERGNYVGIPKVWRDV